MRVIYNLTKNKIEKKYESQFSKQHNIDRWNWKKIKIKKFKIWLLKNEIEKKKRYYFSE